MKPVGSAVLSYLNALRPTGDAPLYFADCYTIWLKSGVVLAYTNIDIPVVLNGFTYLCDSVLVDGLKYRARLGMSVDTQQMTMLYRETDTIGGIPFAQALQQGLFDGAQIQRDRAFFTDWNAAPMGGATLFKGRVATIERVGRTKAVITVASDLVLCDIDMPRNLFQPNCVHVFMDSGCGIPRGTFSTSGSVGASSTNTQINWTGATSAYQQGSILFTSGANTGEWATIKSAGTGVLYLPYPLPKVPATGDFFTATQGCDHTAATCASKFNNIGRFRGFPYVPPPQIVTGPLSNTQNNHKG